jgi:hypothetical protein
VYNKYLHNILHVSLPKLSCANLVVARALLA